MNLDEKLEWVGRQFCLTGAYAGYTPICVGNVNKTYEVRFLQPNGEPKSYLVQNVNTYAFRKPVELMNNIDQVTEHIRRKNPNVTALHFHHTKDRKIYVEDGENFWRMTNYIPSITYSSVNNRNVVRNAGMAFGDFQRQLSDFDINRLVETIPNFHNTRERYRQLEAAIAVDPKGRVAQVQEEIDFLMAAREDACLLTDLQQRGELPVRVTHNDTKINNVLFNPDNDEALVVIDLDTVMPGLMGNDFGDAIRFAANLAEEDCPDAAQAGLNMDIFSVFAEGFLSRTAKTMTKTEAETLAQSCFCLTVELSTRFLADYILGNPYFNIRYQEHNLDRTRCQIALARDMIRNKDKMKMIVRQYVAAYATEI